MNPKQQLIEQEVDVSRYEYDDGVVLAADFGPTTDSAVDLVDDTVIAVVDGEQYEVDVPDAARAFIHNGVFTIEVNE